MAQQTINIGASPNDGTGTPLRTAFQYTNSNFSELYTAVGPSGNNIVVPGNATITGDLTVATDRLKVNTGSTAVQIGSTTQTQIGTTAWPTDLISKASSRVLIGNLGTSIFWNESSPAIGNASTLYIGAKTGAGATTFGGGYISAGTENASDRAGFFALSTFQSNGIDRERYRIDSTGVHTWQYVGGVAGTAMTLNATGLGVGGVPISGFRLNVNNGDFRVSDVQNEDGVEIGWSAGGSNGFVQAYNRTTSAFKDLVLNAAVTINAAGNCGIGVASPSYRLQAAVASGADRNIFAAQIAGASNGFEILWNHATTTTRVIINAIPTSAAGLASGTLWNDAGTIKIA